MAVTCGESGTNYHLDLDYLHWPATVRLWSVFVQYAEQPTGVDLFLVQSCMHLSKEQFTAAADAFVEKNAPLQTHATTEAANMMFFIEKLLRKRPLRADYNKTGIRAKAARDGLDIGSAFYLPAATGVI